MSTIALGELNDYQALPKTGKKRGLQLIAASMIAFTLVFGAAKPAEAVIVPYTKGSDFWYSWFIYSNRAYTAGNVRYSWSWMWEINAHKTTIQSFSSVACGALPTKSASVACAALVVAFFTYMKNQLALALKYKQCLQFRFALPPLGALTSYGIYRVRCVR
jgi:hypothetical protein